MGHAKVLYEGIYTGTELPREVVGSLDIEAGETYRFVSLDGNVFIEKVWI